MDSRGSGSASQRQDWRGKYRELARRYDRLLKRYDEVKGLKQLHQQRAYILEADLRTLNPQLYQQDRKIQRLEERIEKLEAENHALQEQLGSVKGKLDIQSRPLPAFVKANVPQKAKKRPGRKAGHEPAHRPLPETIDRHIEVPAPRDGSGAASCPHCNTQLADVKQHDRIVEDIEPSRPVK